jgi:hypothetical protein
VRVIAMRGYALAALVMLALDAGADEVGLSKGAADPADLGTRCSAMAGREDRAYLDCGKHAPGVSTPTGVAPREPGRTERSGSDSDNTARRYPFRDR